MSAGIDPQAESSERTPQQARKQQLAAAVRAAAANAADEVGGGLALIFAAAPGESGIECASRLRAAAGFSSAQAARDAAQTLLPEVRDALEHRAVGSYGAHPSLGERGVGGTQVHPLICEDRLHGALVIASPAGVVDSKPEPNCLRRLSSCLVPRSLSSRSKVGEMSSSPRNAFWVRSKNFCSISARNLPRSDCSKPIILPEASLIGSNPS
ncbi:MAG: hypothetical protein IIA30_16900 [Myxococcales bacterium]|nr:hypothetical protein [Myxococcales bacterium]